MRQQAAGPVYKILQRLAGAEHHFCTCGLTNVCALLAGDLLALCNAGSEIGGQGHHQGGWGGYGQELPTG